MEPHVHTHENDEPVAVSENNIAQINVLVDEHELEPYKKNYIKEKKKHATLKGFRKGMAPESMIAKIFDNEARDAAKNNVIYNKYIKLLQEHKLRALSEPKISHMHDDNNKIYASLTVDVLQPVILGQYLGLEIEKMPERSVDDALKNTMAEIKHNYPKLTDSDNGIVVDKNMVIADFVAMDAEKQLEKQELFKIKLGDNLYYQAFEEQLLGMKLNENKKFGINFPKTYHKEEFKNKYIQFDLTIKDIKNALVYEDAELAKELSYENAEVMYESITKQIEAKFKSEEHLFYENQILSILLSEHKFNIPSSLISNEIKKITDERPNMTENEATEMAERFVRTDLVLHAIYERHPEIQFTQEQFNEKIAELAARANESVENVVQKLQSTGKLQSYINFLTNLRVVDFLIEMSDKVEAKETNAVITEEK